jgi:ribonuclease P/MRP protein subunit RPP40
MFDFTDDASGREKCYTTVSQLPSFVDSKQVPTKKSPFSAIVNHPFVHTVSVVLSATQLPILHKLIDCDRPRSSFQKMFTQTFRRH